MYWLTEIEAVDSKDGELKLWAGPKVWAKTIEDAQLFLDTNGLGYCKVIGRFLIELPYEDMIIWQN